MTEPIRSADLLADVDLAALEVAFRRNAARMATQEAAQHAGPPALERVPRTFRALLRSPTHPGEGPIAMTAALAAIEALDEDAGRCLLVLSGPPDASKSFGGAWGLVSRGGGLWLDADGLLEAVGNPSRKGELFAPGLVVVDDIGHNDGSPDRQAATAEALETMVKRRCQEHRSTILTTQFPRDALAEWMVSGREHQGGRVPQRWERFAQRLIRHGVRPDPVRLAGLGGLVVGPGLVEVGLEAFADPDLRARQLARRAELATRPPGVEPRRRVDAWNRNRGPGAVPVAFAGMPATAGAAIVLATGQPVAWVAGVGFVHLDDLRRR